MFKQLKRKIGYCVIERSSKREIDIYDPELCYPLQIVFQYLPVKDLFTLSRTSKRFYDDVETYCEWMYKRLSSEIDVNQLFEKQLLTNKDILLQNEMNDNGYSYKRLFTIYKKWSRTYRKSVSTSAAFEDAFVLWLGDNRYMINDFDKTLFRYVVKLIKIPWLEMELNFQNVKPGRYIPKWRMDIENGRWPRETITTIWVSWDDLNGGGERTIDITSPEFEKLQKDLKRLKKGDSIKLKGAMATNYIPYHGWFDLCFGEINLVSVCDVHFGLKNLHSRWKKGMR